MGLKHYANNRVSDVCRSHSVINSRSIVQAAWRAKVPTAPLALQTTIYPGKFNYDIAWKMVLFCFLVRIFYFKLCTVSVCSIFLFISSTDRPLVKIEASQFIIKIFVVI